MRGSMDERRPGVWRLRVFIGDDPITGRKRHASKTFEGTKRQANVELTSFVAKVSRGPRGGTSSMTVAGLLDAFCDHSERIGRSPTTVAKYRQQTELLRSGIGRVKLSRLKPHDLDELYGVLSTRGVQGGRGPLSAASVRRYHALLSAALQQAIKWDWIESNPARRASPPSEPRPKVSAPTPAELRQLIDGAAAVKPAHGILVAFAAITGARRGEVCGLRWSDIDLDAGTVRIWRSIRQVGQELIEGDTKTHQERSVALPAPAVASLQRYRAQIEKASADPFVFSPRPDHSTPYTPDAISRMFARVARDAGLPYHLHQLRHFAATQAIAAGFDAVSVAARLGHADPSVTLRVYSHSLEDRDRALGAALGELVIPGSTK